MERTRLIEQTCKTAINRVGGGMPFAWSLNPYRGCEHACQYCYARTTHAFLGHDAGRDFEQIVYAKTNIAAVLRRELARPTWCRESIAIGTATDPYQAAEGRYRLTRGCLEALVEASNPATITTKGTLVVRDVDLLAELAQRADMRVHVSIITQDEAVWRRLEPGAPPPRQRLRAIERLAAAGVPVGLALAPVIPGVTDHPVALSSLVKAALECGARSIWTGALHLEPAVRDLLLAQLKGAFPRGERLVEQVFGAAGSTLGLRYTPRWQADRLKEQVESFKLAHGWVPAPARAAAAGEDVVVAERPGEPPPPHASAAAVPAMVTVDNSGSRQLALPW